MSELICITILNGSECMSVAVAAGGGQDDAHMGDAEAGAEGGGHASAVHRSGAAGRARSSGLRHSAS